MKNSLFSKHGRTSLVFQLFMYRTKALIRDQCLPSFCPQNVTLKSPMCAFDTLAAHRSLDVTTDMMLTHYGSEEAGRLGWYRVNT